MQVAESEPPTSAPIPLSLLVSIFQFIRPEYNLKMMDSLRTEDHVPSVFFYYSLPTYILGVLIVQLSSLLSLMGSLTIIYMILRYRRKRLSHLLHRIVLGLSISDAIASTATMLQVFLVPKRDSRWPWGISRPARLWVSSLD